MLKNFIISEAIFLLLLSFPVSANADAWVHNKGEAFLSLQAYYYQTDYVFDSNGNSEKMG